MPPSKHTVDITDAAALQQVDIRSITFSEPKTISRDTCVCSTQMPKGASTAPDALVVRIPGAKILRMSSQKGSATVLTKVNKAALNFIMALDDVCLNAAMNKASEWFMHKIKTSLIDDFFRPSTEASSKAHGGVAARFKLLLSEDDMVPNLVEGMSYDMTMKFVGLQFRKQHFCALWKIAGIKHADAKVKVDFVEDDLDDDDDDSRDAAFTDDDLLSQFTMDDIRNMVHDLRASMDALEAYHAAEAKKHKAVLASLKAMKLRLGGIDTGSEQQNDISSSNMNDIMRLVNKLSEELAGLTNIGDPSETDRD